jgi:general secretion pathway protein E
MDPWCSGKRTVQAIAPCFERPDFERALIARLIEADKINPASAERAAKVGAETGEHVEAVLASLGLVSEKEIAEATAAALGLPIARPEDFPDAPVIERGLSPKFLREARAIPIALTEEGLALAMADPLDTYVHRAVAMSVGRPVLPWVAAPSDIQAAHERAFEAGHNQIGRIVDEIEEIDETGTVEDVDRLRDLASEAPVIRLVNLLIVRAIEARASDIHVEPFRSRLLVRYRIDGVLQESAEPPGHLKAAIVSRIKIMARLNIAERRLPQDGRIRFTFRGRDLDLRVSTMPTMYGETVVMRILDRASLVDDFKTLGFAPNCEAPLLEALSRPQGILLVTGPTGSGKTTTLYTGLLRLNTPGQKLFTVEDPIEYELEGVNQVQVKNQIGLNFAHVLRSILRQDPDIIMIGEIRDLETAEVAVQSALTGHLVLSTLHTNDAASTVTRLLDMGVEDYLVTSTVNGVLAQRLVRRLCQQCHGKGCDPCRRTGFHGRMVITEFLTMTDEIRKLVMKHADARELRAAAVAGGMLTMHADGMAKVARGLTSEAEVLRATRES